MASSVHGADPDDERQRLAYEGLRRATAAVQGDMGDSPIQAVPPLAKRIEYQLLALTAESLSHSHHLLGPTGRTHSRASLCGVVLRGVCDIFGRLLYVFDAEDLQEQQARLEAGIAASLRKDIQALNAADRGGANVSAERSELETVLAQLPSPGSAPTPEVLRDHEEYEILAVFGWESASVHLSGEYLASRGRAVTTPSGLVDLALVPVSQYRLGQLTWAAYGVCARTFSMISTRLERPLPRLLAIDADVRDAIQATADRSRDPGEPVSPPYHQFCFPLWGSGS